VANTLIKNLRRHRWEITAVLVLLAIAAFLRLYKIGDYMTFLGDEGRDMLVVKRMIVDHKFTLLGPTASVGGFFLGPIYYYFMAPFLWLFNFDPAGPAVMVALFGTATVLLVYFVGKSFFNIRVGFLSASLYAVSPLIINYSRASWNPNLVPFFSLVVIYSLWRAVSGKPIWLFPAGMSFGVLFQLHYITAFLLPVALFFLLIFGRRKSYLRYYFFAVIGFLITFSPFLLFEIRHGFPNSRSMYQFIFFGQETGFAGQNFYSIITDVVFRLFNRLVTLNVDRLASILIALSLPLFFWRWYRTRNTVFTLLGLWLTFGVFLFGFYQKGIYDYYFGFMYPLPFILTASSLDWFVCRAKLFWVPVTLLVLTLFYVNLKGAPIRFPPNRQMAQARSIAEFILEKAQGQPFNFALITGNNSDHAYRYFFEIGGNTPITIENTSNDPSRVTVTGQLFVVCESLPCSPEGHPLWEIAGFGRSKIENQWPVSVVRVFKLLHYEEKSPQN